MKDARAETHMPEADPTSIGNLAVELGYITTDELMAAIHTQQQRLPLGRLLVDMGKLTEEELSDLLFEQKVRRGEIKNKDVITQRQRSKVRRQMGQIKTGFREMSSQTRQLANSFSDAAQAMKVRLK